MQLSASAITDPPFIHTLWYGGNMTRLKGNRGGSGGGTWLLILLILIVIFLLAYFLYLKPQGILNLGFI